MKFELPDNSFSTYRVAVSGTPVQRGAEEVRKAQEWVVPVVRWYISSWTGAVTSRVSRRHAQGNESSFEMLQSAIRPRLWIQRLLWMTLETHVCSLPKN